MRSCINLFSLSLSPRRAEEQPKGIKLPMRRYQRESLAWMMDIESTGWSPMTFTRFLCADGTELFWHPLTGCLSLFELPVVHGGLLCEEMGLGKTLELLALCLAKPRTDADAKELRFKGNL